MSRRHKCLGARRKIEPKPANCQDKQQSQDVKIIFKKQLAAGSDVTATLDLTVFLKEDCACLKPLVFKLFSAPASSAASERVFSQAGLIKKSSRLSKAMMSD